MNKQIKALQGN